MENIAAFLRACSQIGVPQHELFETVDLYDLQDPIQVITTLRSLSRHAHSKNPAIPVLGPKLTSPTPHRGPAPKPDNIPAWNTRQYGYMGGANQGTEGINMGARRNITESTNKPVAQPPKIIIKATGKPTIAPKPAKLRQHQPVRSIFGQDHESDDDNSTGSNTRSGKTQFLEQRNRVNAELISHQSSVSLESTEDPSIYEYDEVYDSMKAATSKKVETDTGPKYMDKLLEAKRIREADQLRARDVVLKRERQKEGDFYADKEQFVTSAYKSQQQQMQELAKAQEARDQTNGRGLTTFYKKILNQQSTDHEAVVAASLNVDRKTELSKSSSASHQVSDVQRALEINEKAGYNKVILNDQGELVNDRQLLSAGLNIVKKSESGPRQTSNLPSAHSGSTKSYRNTNRNRRDETRHIVEQIQERERQVQQKQNDDRQKLITSIKSQKTDDVISSARQRYLARKKEAAESSITPLPHK